ncbi:MAG: hypothetical protein ABR576_02295 [Thermoanaerobaculia bacterium]
MKRIRIIAAAMIAWGLLAAASSAIDLGVFGAYWDTKDAEETYGAGAKLRLGIIEFRGTYFQDVTADVDPEELDFEIRAIPLEAGIVLQFLKNAPVSPYVGGGGGYYLLDSNAGEIDDEVGYYLVGGLDIGRGIVAFNVEGIYRNFEATVVDTDDDFPELEDEVSFDLSGIGVQAGVIFRF